MKHDRREFLALSSGALVAGALTHPTFGQQTKGTRVILLGTRGGPRVGAAGRNNPSTLILINGIPYVVDCGYGVSRQLLYSSRSYEEIIFREELDRLGANDPSLGVIHTLTRQQPANWNGYGRRIDRAMFEEAAWRPEENPIAYTCGPTALVEKVADLLVELGYRPERIKTERLGPTGVSTREDELEE